MEENLVYGARVVMLNHSPVSEAIEQEIDYTNGKNGACCYRG
jgi:hypothetical protein